MNPALTSPRVQSADWPRPRFASFLRAMGSFATRVAESLERRKWVVDYNKAESKYWPIEGHEEE